MKSKIYVCKNCGSAVSACELPDESHYFLCHQCNFSSTKADIANITLADFNSTYMEVENGK